MTRKPLRSHSTSRFSGSAPKPPTPRALCPLLNTLDRHGNTAAPLDYPSFENRCLAHSSGDQIILTEQATFCLSAAHKECPRYVASIAQSGGAPYPADATEATDTEAAIGFGGRPRAIRQPGTEIVGLESGSPAPYLSEETLARRRKWSWIGAAMIFMSTLLCGGIFAVYVGWQIANSTYVAVQPGAIDTLAEQQLQPQIYLVVTATSEPNSLGEQSAQAQAPDPAGNSGLNRQLDPAQLPQAVTPTPIVIGGENAAQVNPPSQTDVQQSTLGQAAPDDPLPASQPLEGVPIVGVTEQTTQDPPLSALQLEIPTRRPTPILDILAITPAPPGFQESIAMPTPPVGTPMVLFGAAHEILETGECTTVTWNVENVRAVYFDGSGVDGHGSREVCMREQPLNYTLTVMYTDGNPHQFTTTIDFLAPTPTPTPTFTFTPEPYLTPTWTPVPPTSTPTPNVQYGAVLASQSGASIRCVADMACEANLLVTNSGSAIDNLSVEFVDRAVLHAQVCRLDGVCDGNALVIAGMGPGNTALIRLVLQVPNDAAAEVYTYGLRAVSLSSNRNVASNTLQVNIETGQ